MTEKNDSVNSVKSDDVEAKLLPLSYGLSLLKQLLPVPTHVFKSDFHYLEKFEKEQADEWNVLKTDFEFRCKILEEVRKKELAIITTERPVIYGGVKCTDDLYLVVGPVVISKVDLNFNQLYALKHNAKNVSFTFCNVKNFASFLLLVYSSITGRYMYLSEFLDENFLTEQIISQTNKNLADFYDNNAQTFKTHNPESFEADIISSIKNGDSESLKKAHNSIYASMRGTIARNELRNAQNLAIVDITIATRAAIDAGLSSEELYQISDAFILEVEDCRYPSDAEALARACAYRCSSLVMAHIQYQKNADFKGHAVVQMACDYIEKHIYEKFDLSSLCKKLKVSPSYISKLFKKERGMTLSEYSRKRKIDISKVLLESTDKTISEISFMLNFNSQSHFGRTFIKECSISPAQYRRLNIRKMPF